MPFEYCHVLSDLVKCKTRFNVDITKHYISVVVQAGKLILSNNVHLRFINTIFQFCHS